MVVLLLLLSLVILAYGHSLREKSPSTWHAHKLVRATSAVVVAPFVRHHHHHRDRDRCRDFGRCCCCCRLL